MDIGNRAEELFKERYFCAEAVLKALAEAGGKDTPEITMVATGFCSGESRTSNQCGAVSGAIMGIGLYAGRKTPEDDIQITYALADEFLEQFKKKFGSINCTKLCGYDLSTAEGQKEFAETGRVNFCHELSRYAADTAGELLKENGYLPAK